MPTGQNRALFHYPIKGLSAQPLDRVALSPGQGFPFDREWGLARHDSGFDADHFTPLPKDRFLMLMRDERLAGLRTTLDPETEQLTITVQGNPVHEADLSTEAGRAATEAFFARMFDLAPERAPRLVHAAPNRITDVSVVSTALMNAVSLINLDSVAAFGEAIAAEVDPMRFRGNILFDGWPAFSELELEGREIRIGGARARVTLRTRRCAATEVNPATARRDLPLPRLLRQTYGHFDMGVYAEIEEGGEVAPGTEIRV